MGWAVRGGGERFPHNPCSLSPSQHFLCASSCRTPHLFPHTSTSSFPFVRRYLVYSLTALQVDSINVNNLRRDGSGFAVVVATVDESADLWATNGKKGDSYKTTYKVGLCARVFVGCK